MSSAIELEAAWFHDQCIKTGARRLFARLEDRFLAICVDGSAVWRKDLITLKRFEPLTLGPARQGVLAFMDGSVVKIEASTKVDGPNLTRFFKNITQQSRSTDHVVRKGVGVPQPNTKGHSTLASHGSKRSQLMATLALHGSKKSQLTGSRPAGSSSNRPAGSSSNRCSLADTLRDKDRQLLGRSEKDAALNGSKKSVISKRFTLSQSLSTAGDRVAHFTEPANRRGFANLGNTCYLNAVLQSLCQLEAFVNSLAKNRQYLPAPPASPLSNSQDAAQSFYSVLSNLVLDTTLMRRKRKSDGKQLSSHCPSAFKAKLDECKSQFKGNAQQDAHEFLIDCLDQISTDISPCLILDDQGSSGGKPDNVVDPAAVFESSIEQVLTCKSCGHETRSHETFNCYSLDLLPRQHTVPHEDGESCKKLSQSPEHSLTALLGNFFGAEDVQRECGEKCCLGQVSSVSHSICELPKVICLHIKRFAVDTNQCVLKKNDRVELATTLDLKPWLSAGLANDAVATDAVFQRDDDSDDFEAQLQAAIAASRADMDCAAPSASYTLQSCVHHYGDSVGAGHYVTTAFDHSQGSWVRYDDSTAKTTTAAAMQSEATQKEAYLLFYSSAN